MNFPAPVNSHLGGHDMQGRQINIGIIYTGRDISGDIAPYLKSLSYSDELSGQADDLNIVLEDRDGLWQADWFPNKGDCIAVALTGTDWAGNDTLKLGQFEVDEISAKGWPTEVVIKATSVPENNKLRDESRSRSWEKAQLKSIANDIAAEAELTLVYDTEENPTIERAEQTDESDLSFLSKLTGDKGLALKIHDKKLVIFDEQKYEEQDSIMTIKKEMLSGYSF
ncbi:MAG: contractile injection system protein, VgrG/Pvc8 family, partial [Candidatus Cloacimonetes bacterium]|nr:contractile injection system protein, VgrG/Pvc8 family [Candidatus Cloacimonadota bacterium]